MDHTRAAVKRNRGRLGIENLKRNDMGIFLQLFDPPAPPTSLRSANFTEKSSLLVESMNVCN